ncbi:hypothetical protein ACTQWG_10130 [Blautia sp. HCP3S3_H10_1]|uniref:hypothetical protein n=1 Tax=unclassified Blautia TaxID=2648079 RepID=UPI003F92D565|nr:hypothetical protein [Clostridia bacterium]
MPNSKHEDAFLKMGVEYFREHILKLLGINYSYEEIGPTELIALTINELYMDFTFKTTVKDLYIHIEFQTTNNSEKKNLRRFHSYDALFAHNMEAQVITYVIYTGGIEKTKGELNCGIYTYRVIPVYMGKKNADGIISHLKEKKAAGEALTEDDYAQLSLTPLMGGDLSRKDKIKEGILLAKEEHNSMADKVMAMLYTLADKFLDGEELNEIKEAMTMTRLGQMLMDDGIKIGENRGLEIGRIEGKRAGRKAGRREGRKSGEKKMATLYEKLESASRGTEYLRACKDENYRKKLMEEFKIR